MKNLALGLLLVSLLCTQYFKVTWWTYLTHIRTNEVRFLKKQHWFN